MIATIFKGLLWIATFLYCVSPIDLMPGLFVDDAFITIASALFTHFLNSKKKKNKTTNLLDKSNNN